MFKLYAGQRVPKIHVVSDEGAYWRLVEKLSGPRSVFDAQGEAHGHIDSRLVDRIEEILVPLVGPWERSETWFHNLDFYGGGVRSILFRDRDFPRECIPRLQALLVGEAAPFCISVQLCDKLLGENIHTVGAIAILQNDVVVTRELAQSIAFDA